VLVVAAHVADLVGQLRDIITDGVASGALAAASRT